MACSGQPCLTLNTQHEECVHWCPGSSYPAVRHCIPIELRFSFAFLTAVRQSLCQFCLFLFLKFGSELLCSLIKNNFKGNSKIEMMGWEPHVIFLLENAGLC